MCSIDADDSSALPVYRPTDSGQLVRPLMLPCSKRYDVKDEERAFLALPSRHHFSQRERSVRANDGKFNLSSHLYPPIMSISGQTARGGPSNINLPTSPRSNLPGYIRRSSTAISNNNATNSSVSLRNSTIPTTPSTSSTIGSQYFSNVIVSGAAGPDILERPRDRSRNIEVSSSALAFLFAEMVSYTQNRVSGISDLEKK